MANLTSLEDDMRAIGLLSESSEPVAEGMRRIKTQKSTSSQRRKWRQAARKNKGKRRAYAKKASTKRKLKIRNKKRDAMGLNDKPRANRVRVMVTGLEKVADLMESVDRTLSNIESASTRRMLEGFGELALSAAELADSFGSYADAHSSVKALISGFLELSQDLCDLAEAMSNGGSVSETKLQDAFLEAVEYVTNGADLLSDLVEAEEDCECEDEEDCDCDEGN